MSWYDTIKSYLNQHVEVTFGMPYLTESKIAGRLTGVSYRANMGLDVLTLEINGESLPDTAFLTKVELLPPPINPSEPLSPNLRSDYWQAGYKAGKHDAENSLPKTYEEEHG